MCPWLFLEVRKKDLFTGDAAVYDKEEKKQGWDSCEILF
jgi:hypothetical protein